MPTEEQYAMIGRLSFAFNELEDLWEMCLALVLATPEGLTAEVVAQEGQFRTKLRRYSKVLEAIAKSHPHLESDVSAALEVLKKVEKVSEEHNQFIHALVLEDPRTKEGRLRVKEKGNRTFKPFSEVEVGSLVKRAEILVTQLTNTFANSNARSR